MTRVAMGRRPLLAMALGWLVVVLAVGAITFVVVDRAGRGVGQASAARTVAPVPTSSGSGATSPGGAPTPTATPTPSPVASRTPGQPAIKPSVEPSPRPAEVRVASFTTEGGTVVAECAGTALRLVSITPRDGWRFEQEAEDRGLEVKFESGESDVEIVVVCSRGVPVRDER